ncbi:hypothetical protein HPP92_022902 [Vanilla planifolia]|uniref:BAH domain-containing protein n=1 Tax=Vanilla planifolia TaxID=51239 RepID=A0A835UE94_VANPL|nr:hypothetical protein HPP92_023329 [Vanilla planifolia]KAG0459774.1 hypothetical protein HPP92_022902 [Vanilla planifolia]
MVIFNFNGVKKGVGNTNKDVQFYESFVYDGESYLLYDNVYLFKEGDDEPYVGKILKVWEQPGHKRRVKILWFFRANDIHVYLDGHASSKKGALFSFTGEGVGLFNINPLEAIAGKCNVICTSHDERNLQASSVAIEKADFIFSRIFDVGTCTVSERLPEKIAGIEVEYLLNRREDQKPDLYVKAKAVDSEPIADKLVKKLNQVVDSVKLPLDHQKIYDSDKGLVIKSGVGSAGTDDKIVQPVDVLVKKTLDEHKNNETFPRKRKFISYEDSPDNDLFKLSKGSSELLELSDDKNRSADVLSQNVSAAVHRSKWFGNMPWKTRLEKAHMQGRLVFLDNLDLSYSSSEIEDLLRGALKIADCTVRIIPQVTFQNPNYGQAYVIFNTRNEASRAVQEMDEKCLILSDGRPVCAKLGMLELPQKAPRFPGHLKIEKARSQAVRLEQKKAVSTSHCSQPNTIEYELALEWLHLQEKYRRAKEKMLKKQDVLLRAFMRKYKEK